eukprot:TRINITY_DN28909_c0_g1_i1.p1 TRINITY_DN28909_c0_g1~~TRINITY_DN28909_c0_g1_i1.p1  ORF type:complete len:390 (+),score=94.00 TRINITY_DN28909_c0_g1_i1:66-1235(+)
MAKEPTWKAVLAGLVATLLLWKPAITVMFPGFIYTSDLSTVFLFNACIGASTQTVFVFCLLEVLVACVLLANYAIPAMFGERWEQFDHLKQRKLVGFVVKILVRVACAVQILCVVVPRFRMASGLFAEFNVKSAAADLSKRAVTTCDEAGMGVDDAVALRAWVFTRDAMMAVMVWELAFIPELPTDAWLHHLFVILGVAVGSDPNLLSANAGIQPLIDGIALFLVLGAALAAAVEAAVLMYHLSAPNARAQANWMVRSLTVQVILVTLLFVTIPAILAVWHREKLGFLTYGLLLLIVFLATVEAKMIVVKWAIVKSARRKAAAREQAALPPSPPEANDGGAADAPWRTATFTHDLQEDLQEAKADAAAESFGSRNPSRTEMAVALTGDP